MATYFVNASGSATAPYDTPAKGHTSIGALSTALGGFSSGDIVEVTDDATITEATGNLNGAGATFRSYSANTSKPILNVTATTALFNTFANNTKWLNLHFRYDQTVGATSVGFITANSIGTITGIEVKGCKFENLNIVSNARAGMDINSTSLSGLVFENNVGIDVRSIANLNGGYGAACSVVNNSVTVNAGSSGSGIHAFQIDGYVSTVFNNAAEYIAGGSSNQMFRISGGTFNHDYNIGYNFSSWGATQQANESTSDPQFLSDLQVPTGSPAIDNGASSFNSVNAPSDDYLGVSRPQGSGYDIGSYEFNEVVTCWNLTGRYNTGRYFRLDGPADCPAEIKVPKNADLSSIVVIEHGIKLNPDRYKIVQ